MKFFTLLIFTISSLLSSSFDMKGGDVIGKNIHGVITNFKHNPIQIDTKSLIIEDNSFNGFLNISNQEEDMNQDFLISSFISDKGIGAIYLTKTNLIDNKINYIDTQSLDLSPIFGIYNPSKAYKTPWNTFMFIQNKLIDSKDDNDFKEKFSPYFQNKKPLVHSYNYGWNFEVVVLNTKGDAKAINNFAMGRTFSSHISIMPDNQTVYMYDSKYSKNLYLFVAEKPADFLKGKLYVASKIDDQIQWKLLGNNSALRIKLKMKKELSFKDIYKSEKVINNKCTKNYTYITSVYGKECLQLQKKFKKFAGALEPIRQTALLGVQTFLNEENTMTYDKENNTLIFTKNNSISYRFKTNNEELNSKYIIK